eukprot:TRINITY_DN8605_c0_g1_i1.p1 TRINITY_DN8605_c0_g1~~TRINITY_DN8605_c0_g1_i1.p1  ORF type:complete len:485 (+),score=89.48 TRINITY_DN8605_c0_g1_i1:108-1562(+)
MLPMPSLIRQSIQQTHFVSFSRAFSIGFHPLKRLHFKMSSVIDVDQFTPSAASATKPLISRAMAASMPVKAAILDQPQNEVQMSNGESKKNSILHGYLISKDGGCVRAKWPRSTLRTEVTKATQADLEAVKACYLGFREHHHAADDTSAPATPVHSTPKPKRQLSSFNYGSGARGEGSSLKLRHPLQISSRDLRQLDLHASKTSEPFVAVRFGVILVKLPLYRALILRERMYLLTEQGADGELESLLNNVSTLCNNKMPFELACMDLLFSSVIEHNRTLLAARTKEIRDTVTPLNEKSTRSTSVELDQLREVKVKIGQQLQALQRLDNALDNVIEDENELTFMRLTQYHEHPDEFFEAMMEPTIPRTMFEGTEAQMEDHLQDVSELIARLEIERQGIDNYESQLTFALDERRNQLLAISTMLNVATTLFAAGGLVAGLFGMNLANGHEGSQLWFDGVVITVVTTIIVGFGASISAMLKAGLFRL